MQQDATTSAGATFQVFSHKLWLKWFRILVQSFSGTLASKHFIIIRLWLLQNYLTLLDDEDHTLESLKIQDDQQLVIEGMEHFS